MPQQLLSRAECLELILLLRRYFSAAGALKSGSPLGVHLQYPKVPGVLGESIAADLLSTGGLVGGLRDARRPRAGQSRGADLVATGPEDGIVPIAVKSTGRQGFQNLTRADLSCEFLAWLHFGPFFEDPACTAFRVHVLRSPRTHFPVPCKLGIAQVAGLPETIHASVEVAGDGWVATREPHS